MPTLSAELCSRCGCCVEVCPYQLLEHGRDGLPALQTDWQSRCLACGHCSAVCPTEALRGDGAPTWRPLPDSLTYREMLAQLQLRRSVRQYQDRHVPREVVAQVLEAARGAPTGHNARHLGCVIVASAARRARLTGAIGAAYRWLGRGLGNPLLRIVMALWLGPARVRELGASLPGLRWAGEQMERGGDPLFHRAPLLLLFHAPRAETAEADCALAAGQVSLLVPTLGLGSCHIGYASALLKRLPGIARRYGVPRGHRVFAVLTLGYPAVTWRGVPQRPELPAVWR